MILQKINEGKQFQMNKDTQRNMVSKYNEFRIMTVANSSTLMSMCC